MSQITTHILDTSAGKPAADVAVILEQFINNDWLPMASGITNEDGRIGNLLSSETKPGKGIYRLIFVTQSYFQKRNIKTFYPKITIEFEIADDLHYHVPLLLNPFGYSTYRGS